MVKPKRCGIYVRVSTTDQSTKAQEAELRKYAENRGWLLSRVYADKVSGTKQSRPALDELMADCRKRKLDVVLVWKFDRFARSLRHLVLALEEFKNLGVDFVSLTEAVNTATAQGELVLQIFGGMAQFERSLIVERVKAGLEQARRDGKTLGRPAIKKLSEKEIERIRAERSKGVTLRELAKKFGASLWSVYQASLG